MAPVAIVFGVLLTLLGGGIYVYTEMASPTALIPAFFGLPLIVLGVLALTEKFRKHAMHVAALLGLIGFIVPLGRVIYVMTKPDFQFGPAVGASISMAALCAIFFGGCVNSFLSARSARKKKEAETPPPPPM